MNMVELVRFIAKTLVDKPDAVDVREVEGPESIVIELRVDPEDMGKVIGNEAVLHPVLAHLSGLSIGYQLVGI